MLSLPQTPHEDDVINSLECEFKSGNETLFSSMITLIIFESAKNGY